MEDGPRHESILAVGAANLDLPLSHATPPCIPVWPIKILYICVHATRPLQTGHIKYRTRHRASSSPLNTDRRARRKVFKTSSVTVIRNCHPLLHDTHVSRIQSMRSKRNLQEPTDRSTNVSNRYYTRPSQLAIRQCAPPVLAVCLETPWSHKSGRQPRSLMERLKFVETQLFGVAVSSCAEIFAFRQQS